MNRFAFVVALSFLLVCQALLQSPSALAEDVFPIVTIDQPVFPTLAEVKDIGGTVYDPDGIDKLVVQVHRVGDLAFWNGSNSWQAQPIWFPASIDGLTWWIENVDLSVPDRYIVRFASRDLEGNYALARDIGIQRISSIVDVTPPTGALTIPAQTTVYRIISAPPQTVTENGVVTYRGPQDLEFSVRDDGIGVASVFSQVVHVDSGEYWNGISWQANPAWCPMFQGPILRSRYESPAPVDLNREGRYVIRMSLRDKAGNVSTSGDNPKYELFVVADNEPPVGFLVRPPTDYFILPDGRVGGFGNTVTAGVQDVSGKVQDTGTGADEVRVQIVRSATSEFWNGASWQATPAWIQTFAYGPNRSSRNWIVRDVDLTAAGTYAVRLVTYDLDGNRSGPTENWRSFMNVVP